MLDAAKLTTCTNSKINRVDIVLLCRLTAYCRTNRVYMYLSMLDAGMLTTYIQ